VGCAKRITDNLLWLPYVVAHYVKVTGDVTLLKDEEPFRRGKPLANDEAERYDHYPLTEETYTIYEHCRRALAKGATGPHGLPLMGGGDWNDGMNRVGIEGRGEKRLAGLVPIRYAVSLHPDVYSDGGRGTRRALSPADGRSAQLTGGARLGR
jgi:cellobiose phosphorylase